jgi:alpha-ribazole phosphatase
MKGIYLIRHTSPDIAKGICYGQTDIGLKDSFAREAGEIRGWIPENIESVYSSPLSRCRRLAELLFPAAGISFENDLMEMNCGSWELKVWDQIPKEELSPWMEDFVHRAIPEGESYTRLHERVVRIFSQIAASGKKTAIITHGGVIRSILSHITGTPLAESFGKFSIHYGCVTRIDPGSDPPSFLHLHNQPPQEKEQHKPGSFYSR